jgi:uncharacterized protein YxjI
MVRQRMFSIGDDFWITDERGDRAFLVEGSAGLDPAAPPKAGLDPAAPPKAGLDPAAPPKALSIHQTLEIKDGSGAVAASVHKKPMALRDSMEIERDGQVIATVRREMFAPLHHKSSIDLADGRTLEAVGNLTGREFDIRDGGHTLARVSRAWFTMRDTYGVDVVDGEDAAMLLAVAVCLDRIHHEEDGRHAG